MSKVPTISILTPVWNGLPYIKETIESVLSQDFQDWEMIIGDNASTDGTSEYLQSLKDPRIKVYRHEKNGGVYKNIHFVFSKATAPIFVGLCADDYFYPGALRKVVEEWQKVGPEVGLMTFNWKSRQIKHNRLQAFGYEVLPNYLRGLDARIAFFLFGCFPGNFSEMSGRPELAAAEDFLYHVRYSADYEFWMKIANRSGIQLNNTDVVYIRRHDRVAATYTITKGEYHEETIDVYERLIDDLSRFVNRQDLINFYNVELCSYHLRDAIKSALRGKFTAIKSFLSLKSPIFWPTGLQFIGCLPFALSERLRYATSISLAKKILKSYKAEEFQMEPVRGRAQA